MNNFFKIFSLIFILALSHNTYCQSARSLVNDGVELYNNKKYSDAEVNFRKSLEQDPQNMTGNFNLGDAYYKQGKYEDAIKSFQSVFSKSQDKNVKAKSLYNIGNSLLKSQKLEESIDAYKNSLKLNPNDEDTKYNLSYALKQLQQQKNQQNKNDKNKDQNKDKDQQNKDKQNQNQQNKDQNNKQNQQQPKQQEQNMSKEEAERILDAIKDNEKDIQKKLRQKTAVKVKTDKDW
jgi:tetratricopeptide (TPR) repeat protein